MIRLGRDSAALLTSTSTPPKSAMIRCAVASQLALSRTSQA